jgi:hypothetical protein
MIPSRDSNGAVPERKGRGAHHTNAEANRAALRFARSKN